MQDVGIQQISASYDGAEDRLVLRLRTTDGAELRCWITRRYLRLLWDVLRDLLRGFAEGTDPLQREALAEFAHGKALAEADFATPYEQGSHFPLGETPFVAGRISVRPRPDKLRTLVIEPLQGPGIALNLNEPLTHLLSRLLHDAASVAEWNLGLSLEFGPHGGKSRSALH